jgi:hypothetical protein
MLFNSSNVEEIIRLTTGPAGIPGPVIEAPGYSPVVEVTVNNLCARLPSVQLIIVGPYGADAACCIKNLPLFPDPTADSPSSRIGDASP